MKDYLESKKQEGFDAYNSQDWPGLLKIIAQATYMPHIGVPSTAAVKRRRLRNDQDAKVRRMFSPSHSPSKYPISDDDMASCLSAYSDVEKGRQDTDFRYIFQPCAPISFFFFYVAFDQGDLGVPKNKNNNFTKKVFFSHFLFLVPRSPW